MHPPHGCPRMVLDHLRPGIALGALVCTTKATSANKLSFYRIILYQKSAPFAWLWFVRFPGVQLPVPRAKYAIPLVSDLWIQLKLFSPLPFLYLSPNDFVAIQM